MVWEQQHLFIGKFRSLIITCLIHQIFLIHPTIWLHLNSELVLCHTWVNWQTRFCEIVISIGGCFLSFAGSFVYYLFCIFESAPFKMWVSQARLAISHESGVAQIKVFLVILRNHQLTTILQHIFIWPTLTYISILNLFFALLYWSGKLYRLLTAKVYLGLLFLAFRLHIKVKKCFVLVWVVQSHSYWWEL